MNKKWLIIGGNGYFGIKIAEELKKRNYPFKAVDKNVKYLPNHLVQYFKELDIQNRQELQLLLETYRPDIVVNAIGHGSNTSKKYLKSIYIECTENLLDLIKTIISESKVIIIGSAAEYGNTPENRKSKETDPTCPISVYGKIKVRQTQIAQNYHHNGLNVTVARIFNAVGPGQSLNLVAGALMKRLEDGEKPLMVNATNYIRDFLDIRDIARAITCLGEARIIHFPIINICSGREHTIGELAKEIVVLCGGVVQPVPQPIGPDFMWRSVGDNTLLCQFGWNPKISIQRSLYDQWKSVGSPIQKDN